LAVCFICPTPFFIRPTTFFYNPTTFFYNPTPFFCDLLLVVFMATLVFAELFVAVHLLPLLPQDVCCPEEREVSKGP
jgi:hypothetical protein